MLVRWIFKTYQPSIREGCVLSSIREGCVLSANSKRAMRERKGQMGEGAEKVKSHTSDLVVFGLFFSYVVLNYYCLPCLCLESHS